MGYAVLKMIHVTCVVLSGTGFVWRGIRMLQGVPSRSAYLRVLPHVVDTLLLASALGMLFAASWNPLGQPWLMAKLSALLVYIGLGAVALKHGRTPQVRRLSFLAACAVFVYIVLAARTHSPWVGLF